MRFFEMLTLVTLSLSLVGIFWPAKKRPQLLRIQPLLVAVSVLVHAIVEGMRWQLIPAYLLAGFLCLIYLKGRIFPIDPNKFQTQMKLIRASAGLGIVATALTAALALILPVFELPVPEGPYAVGTTSFHWTDRSRGDPFTADTEDCRQIYVQAWYPAKISEGMKAEPYIPEASQVLPGMVRLMFDYIRQKGGADFVSRKPRWTPTFLFNHVRLVRSHSFKNAPFAEMNSKCPVLFFSHGYLVGHVRQNTALLEHLASHGYVAFSIAHPHETLFWTKDDGSLVLLDGNNPRMRTQREAVMAMNSDSANAAIEAILEAPTSADRDIRLRTFLKKRVADRDATSERLWLEDTRFVVDQAEKLSDGRYKHPFNGRLDLSRLGILGMSYGGRLVSRFCSQDSRCGAGLDLDGGLPFLDSLDSLPTQSMMVVYPAGSEARYDLFYNRLHGTVYRISLRGANHFHFMEFAIMFDPIFRMNAIDPSRALRIINDYALAFFDQELRGKTPLLLRSPSPYPEAIFTLRDH